MGTVTEEQISAHEIRNNKTNITILPPESKAISGNVLQLRKFVETVGGEGLHGLD